MRVVFLGTPGPAALILERIVSAGHEVVLVITRPDAKRGRGSELSPTPVKMVAQRLGLPVAHELSALDTVTADIGVVVAYGALIPAARLLALPMLNVHFSLLPRWRGAAPVERSILAGDQETGVDVMTLEPTLDTGPIHFELRTPVAEKTAEELLNDLTNLGGEAILTVLGDPALLSNSTPQVGEPTYAAKLTPSDFVIAPRTSVLEALRIIRLGRTRVQLPKGSLRLVQARASEEVCTPGEIVKTGSQVILGLMDGAIELVQVRPEGSASMSATAWWSGVRSIEMEWSEISQPGNSL